MKRIHTPPLTPPIKVEVFVVFLEAAWTVAQHCMEVMGGKSYILPFEVNRTWKKPSLGRTVSTHFVAHWNLFDQGGWISASFFFLWRLANIQPNLVRRSLVDEASSTRDLGRRLYPCACRISHDMNPDIFAGLTIRSWESVETRFRCIKRWRLLKTRLSSHLLTR